ncbi:MAG TPA: helix-turn-helix domain-containing protein [Candidatus Gallimonas gallistercoris]|uniref:Helix-turn-helix domain-containing protein n=1 Tax=Candidatus Gallimonas gallistercoris TaxID=2838602 RepID=A0A9D2KG66_9FIRM|nr:helix-turn-helix domain-containing protein [Candidatus Gallimonas gallistercoris]
MITLEQIRERLAEAIRNSGMTQTELARRLGIRQPTIGQYLSGRSMPALDTFANLCKVLDVDANDILCLDEHTDSTR